MLAIHTKYIRPSNQKSSRIKAYTSGWGECKGYTATISYPHDYTGERAHFQAVKALVKKHGLDWNLDAMRWGDSADGKGYTFCFAFSVVNEG